MIKVRRILIGILMIAGVGISPAEAASYNSVTSKLSQKLATLGLFPGTLDGLRVSIRLLPSRHFRNNPGYRRPEPLRARLWQS